SSSMQADAYFPCMECKSVAAKTSRCHISPIAKLPSVHPAAFSALIFSGFLPLFRSWDCRNVQCCHCVMHSLFRSGKAQAMSITISNYSTPSLPPATASARNASATDETAPVATDKVTLQGQSSDPVTYANPRSGTAQAPDLASMLEESNRKAQAIIDLIVP